VRRSSVVGIATSYGLYDGGVGVQVPDNKFLLQNHIVQTGSGVHPVSYPMGTAALSVGGGGGGGLKRQGH
jgi:hypothetical protein